MPIQATAGLSKRDETKERQHQPEWLVAMMPSQRKRLKGTPMGAVLEKLEKLKAAVRAKVEHPFQGIKCRWGYRKTRYQGLLKNAGQITVLFALSNLWMARRALLSQLTGAQA